MTQMSNLIILCVFSTLLFFYTDSQKLDYVMTFSGGLQPNVPVTAEFYPQINDTDFFDANMTISLDSYSEEEVIVCIQEEPLPLPSYLKYQSCTYRFVFKANPNPHTTTSTTGGSTSTTGTTSTTGKSTTSTTGGTTSTTGGTTSTTGKSTTSTTGGTTSTTGGTTSTTSTTSTTGSSSSTGDATTSPGKLKSPRNNLLAGGSGFSVKNLKDTQGFPPLRARNYIAGVYYNTVSNNHKSFNISFTIRGKYCINGTGDDCSTKIMVLPENTTMNITGINYFSYMFTPAPTLNQTLNNLMVNFRPADNKNVTIYARYSGIPSKTLYDATSTSNITLYAPKSGTWIFAVEGTDITISPDSKINYCANNTAGVDCKLNITSANGLPSKFITSKIAKTNDLHIYALSNVTYKSLYVSLYDEKSDKKAIMYASFNRVPVLVSGKVEGADISSCNNDYCQKVQSISTKYAYMSHENGTWYIAVQAGRDTNEYNLWFDFVCPNNCSGHGTCKKTPTDFGMCDCEQTYDTLLCSPSNMIIEYIILIVIAALVLISALIGLVAWAVMRRRSQYVEVR